MNLIKSSLMLLASVLLWGGIAKAQQGVPTSRLLMDDTPLAYINGAASVVGSTTDTLALVITRQESDGTGTVTLIPVGTVAGGFIIRLVGEAHAWQHRSYSYSSLEWTPNPMPYVIPDGEDHIVLQFAFTSSQYRGHDDRWFNFRVAHGSQDGQWIDVPVSILNSRGCTFALPEQRNRFDLRPSLIYENVGEATVQVCYQRHPDQASESQWVELSTDHAGVSFPGDIGLGRHTVVLEAKWAALHAAILEIPVRFDMGDPDIAGSLVATKTITVSTPFAPPEDITIRWAPTGPVIEAPYIPRVARVACAGPCVTHRFVDYVDGQPISRSDIFIERGTEATHDSGFKIKLHVKRTTNVPIDEPQRIEIIVPDAGGRYNVYNKKGRARITNSTRTIRAGREELRLTYRIEAKNTGTVPIEVRHYMENGDWRSSHVRFSVVETMGTIAEDEHVPATFSLEQNYPNPFNPTTTITYNVPQDAHVTLRVYDVMGRVVQELVNDTQATGTYQASFDGAALSSGTYFAKMVAGDVVQTKRLLLVK